MFEAAQGVSLAPDTQTDLDSADIEENGSEDINVIEETGAEDTDDMEETSAEDTDDFEDAEEEINN